MRRPLTPHRLSVPSWLQRAHAGRADNGSQVPDGPQLWFSGAWSNWPRQLPALQLCSMLCKPLTLLMAPGTTQGRRSELFYPASQIQHIVIAAGAPLTRPSWPYSGSVPGECKSKNLNNFATAAMVTGVINPVPCQDVFCSFSLTGRAMHRVGGSEHMMWRTLFKGWVEKHITLSKETYNNRNFVYSFYRLCKNLKFEKLTHKMGFVVKGHICLIY